MYHAQLKGELKSDIINHLDEIKFENIEIKGQQQIKELKERSNESIDQIETKIIKISEKITELVFKIDEICTLALKDIDEYFNKLDSDSNDFLINKTKNEIKKDAIKHYLIYLNGKELNALNYEKTFKYKFGLIIQIDFYPDENDRDLIK